MIASKSNFANQATVTATPASALQDINVITDGDYSSVYTDSLSGQLVITMVFPTEINVGYIALGGTNIARKDAIKITTSGAPEPIYLQTNSGEQLVTTDPFDLTVSLGGVGNGSVADDNLEHNESSVMMYRVDGKGVRRITITIYGGGSISIAEIAVGDYYEIPKGEQGGYNRPWTVPNIMARSTTGLDGSPVNLSYEARPLKCTLSVPNNIMRDFDGWYEFINFAATNTFYILEDLDKYHSYACFNAKPAMTAAHSQTRKLGVSAITFNAFAKSTEALF